MSTPARAVTAATFPEINAIPPQFPDSPQLYEILKRLIGQVTLTATAIPVTFSGVVSVAPVGAVDNSNLTYLIPSTPLGGVISLYRNGLFLRPDGVDYVLSDRLITMTSAPQTGTPNDWLWSVYVAA